MQQRLSFSSALPSLTMIATPNSWEEERATLLLKLRRAENRIAELELHGPPAAPPRHRPTAASPLTVQQAATNTTTTATASPKPRSRLVTASLLGLCVVAVLVQCFAVVSAGAEQPGTCEGGGCEGAGAGVGEGGGEGDDAANLFHKVGRIFNDEERKARREKHDDADAVGE